MKTTRRAISFAVAVAMMLPTFSSAAEAAMVNWLSPQPGQKMTTARVEVAVGYNTQSDTKVTRLELWVDGKLNARKDLIRPETRGVCSFWWDTTGYSNGLHDLVVRVYAGDVLLSKVNSSGTVGDVTFDMDPPVVSFSGIKTGDVIKGNTEIRIDAKDNSGQPPLVSLKVDNALKLVQNRPPYIYDLDTTAYEDGKHELQTYAYDGAGNKSAPAVVNVSFKNNAARPVVTAVTVSPSSTPAASEDDGTNVILPTVAEAKVAPVEAIAPTPRAGRTAEAPKMSPVVAKPIAPKVSAVPAKQVVVAEASAPIRVPARVVPQLRSGGRSESVTHVAQPVAPSIAKTSIKTPELVAKARELASKPIPVVSRPPAELASISEPLVKATPATPSTRAESNLLAYVPNAAAEPVREVNPDTSSPAPVMMAQAPSLRGSDYAGLASASVGAQEMLADPVSSDVRKMVASDHSAKLRSDRQAGCATVSKRVAMAPSLPSATKAVSYVDDASARARVKTSIKSLPDMRLHPDAKLEKKVLPASGKVKLRDLVNQLGGVVFWDVDSHTVTAYVGDIHMVFEIGSHTALVNGKEMHIDHVPFIAKGRTVISAEVYHQAMTFAANSSKVARVASAN